MLVSSAICSYAKRIFTSARGFRSDCSLSVVVCPRYGVGTQVALLTLGCGGQPRLVIPMAQSSHLFLGYVDLGWTCDRLDADRGFEPLWTITVLAPLPRPSRRPSALHSPIRLVRSGFRVAVDLEGRLVFEIGGGPVPPIGVQLVCKLAFERRTTLWVGGGFYLSSEWLRRPAENPALAIV